MPFSSFSEDIDHTKDGSLIHSYGIHHSLLVFTDWGKDIQGWQSDSQLWLTSWSVFIDWGKDIHHTKDGSLSDWQLWHTSWSVFTDWEKQAERTGEAHTREEQILTAGKTCKAIFCPTSHELKDENSAGWSALGGRGARYVTAKEAELETDWRFHSLTKQPARVCPFSPRSTQFPCYRSFILMAVKHGLRTKQACACPLGLKTVSFHVTRVLFSSDGGASQA